MRVRYLLVTVGLGLAALTALMMIGSSAAAQEGAGAPGVPNPQPHNGVTCHATVDGSGTVYTSASSQAVRDAVDDAGGGDLVKVSGYCAGATTIQGIAVTVYISKGITLRGGYNTDWTYDPDAYPTTLDAGHAGRVVVISATTGVTLDSLHIVSGTTLAIARGGGIYVTEGAAATVSHSTISGNTAKAAGGGLSLTAGTAVTVSHSTISGNTAKAAGGGIDLAAGAAVTVSHSTVFSNTAETSGGGFYLAAGAAATVTSSTIYSNTASNGGGIFNQSGTLNLTNSTVSGNEAVYDGGGIANLSAIATLINSTVSGNLAGRWGGGVTNSGSTVDLKDTIISSQREGDDCWGGGITSQGHNLDSDGTCNLTAASDIPFGTADLGPLQLNAPGETATHALGPNSDALDAGSCADGTVDGDQRGVARPQGEACDIGAYEAEVRCWATVDGSGTVYRSANSQAVRDAVDDAAGSDLVKVSGYCAGVEAIEGLTVTVYISKNITVKGGYDLVWTYDPGAYPTTLDAVHAGQVVVISDTNGATLDSLRIVSGTILGAYPDYGYGGGIFVSKDAAATVSHSTVYSNTASDAGGGIFVSQGALNLTQSTVNDNRALYGGGIYVWGGPLNLTQSTVNDNRALYGGGIRTYLATLNLTNCTVSGNTADSKGGGIYNRTGPLNLTNCTVSGNTAIGGGGIYADTSDPGPVNLRDTIVADQQSGTDCFGDITSQGYNLDSDGSCGLNVLSNDIVNGTADLGPLQVNAPGETATHALGPNSEALDAGNCAGGTVDVDQRGVARPQGDACDIGSYEARLAMAVSKSADVPTATVGQQIQYTYRVTNTSDVPLTGVEARDDRLGSVPLAGQVLAPGATTAGTLSYTVAASDLPGPLLNTVTVSGTPPVGSDVTATDSASVALTGTGNHVHHVFLPLILKDY